MSYAIQVNESTASRRVVYLWCVQSNGTSAATNEAGGRPRMSVGGLSMWTTENTLSAISANAGLYSLLLGSSDISLLGQGTVQYSSGTALPNTVNVEIVGYNPFTAYSLFSSSDSVGLKAQTHSGATIAGVTRVNSSVTIADADYSAVTVRVGGIAPATYSGVTVGVNNVDKAVGAISGLSFLPAPGEYSSVTVRASVLSGHTPQTGDNYARLGAPAGASVSADVAAVKSDTAAIKAKTDQVTFTVANRVDATINSAVTLAAGRYSDVTIGGVEALESAVTLAAGRYSDVTIGGVEKVESGVTVDTGGIVAASFGAGAIDAVAIATDATEDIADGVLGRNVAGGSSTGRTVSQALYALRNRVAIDGSIGTVYQVNDSTSAWTFSVATVSTSSGLINSVDPG